MSLKGLRFTLDVDGLGQKTFAVVNFVLRQRHSFPFVLDIDVASDSFGETAEKLLEKNATLTIWQGNTPQRYVSGIVTRFGMKEYNGWQMCYCLTITPPLWRSGLRQNFRIFQQQDIQTISATLLEENGITDWKPWFYEDHPAREFCVQYGETDLTFLTRLWSEEGIFFFDRFAADSPAQTLTLCDNVAGLSDAGELPFNPNCSLEITIPSVSTFSYQAQIRPSSVETQDYTFKMPQWPGYYGHSGENLNGQRKQYEVFDWPGRFKDEQHGQDVARYLIEGWRNNAETAACISNSPLLWPGTTFTLTGHPVNTLNQKWQVVSSVLTGKQPQAMKGGQGNRTTDVTANHRETIGGNQLITVKQNQIQTVVQNQKETVGQNQSVTVGMNQAETVGIVRALSVGVAYQTTVGGVMNTSVALMQSSQVGIQKSLLVGKGYDVSVGENVNFTVGKTRTEGAGKVAVYSAGEHLELRSGQARLVLTQDGKIFLNGTDINLQGVQTLSGDALMINWNCGAAEAPPKVPEESSSQPPDMRKY